jgi:hypothetical protein
MRLYLICRIFKLDNKELLYIMSKEPKRKREENNEENYEQDERE